MGPRPVWPPAPRLRLSPILRHMGAPEELLAWLAECQYSTFREAWEAMDYGHLLWILFHADTVACAIELEKMAYADSPFGDEDALRARVPAATIERALYEYAVTHGCAEVAT